ncbi:CHAD domain-containing protein [Streptomyces sp. SID13588]|uniref:CHAD domain-containing protein n=1 Tax=Streptomyces sp. SID13588 TaxID=2706051 RepID=UPI0013CDD4D6|nr:CHAD domain-containing protein [Streptomyces sp. SID13588]NEA73849.1 CHAD domain-containing protein [Streptomyces sp. SID13588]
MAYLRSQRERLTLSERAIRQDLPDAAFDLRTAVRRIRAALRTYRPLVADDQLVTELIDELCRQLGRTVSVARDAQVARARITAGLDELDDELRRGPVRALVSTHFAQVDAAANAALSEALDSPRWLAVRSRLELFIDDPALTVLAERPAGTELLVHIRSTAKSLLEAVRTGDITDGGLHKVRKTARHLRESALVARPVVGSPVKRSDRRLQKLQRMLGEHQDTVISRRALAELHTTAQSAGQSGFTFALLYGQERARAEAVRNKLPRCWDRTWRPAYVGWLDAPW